MAPTFKLKIQNEKNSYIVLKLVLKLDLVKLQTKQLEKFHYVVSASKNVEYITEYININNKSM